MACCPSAKLCDASGLHVATRFLSNGRVLLLDPVTLESYQGDQSVLQSCEQSHSGVVNVLERGAINDGTGDNTALLQGLIDECCASGGGELYFPIGVYRTTAPLTFNGEECSVKLQGVSGFQSTRAGGVWNETTSHIRYAGPAGGSVIEWISGQGNTLSDMCLSTESAAQNQIDIPGVVGVRQTNSVLSKYHAINRCSFLRFEAGVHYVDDGASALSDANMDGNRIEMCHFNTVETGIRVEQQNVFDTKFNQIHVFGAGGILRHAIEVVKGHAYADTVHVSAMRNDGSAIAFVVDSGALDLSNVYAESHNGSLFHWRSAAPNLYGCTLTNVKAFNSTATNPNDWNIRNSTGEDLNIYGGRLQQVMQDNGTGGKIYIWGAGPGYRAISPNALNDPASIFVVDETTL